MKTNNLLLGVGIGIGIGFIASQLYEQKINPEIALKKAKNALKEVDIDKIIGSWIHTQPEKFMKHGLTYEVYNGGVSSKNEKAERQFNFKIDAKTGTIIELNEE